MLECLVVIYVKSIQASTYTHTRTHLLENTQNDQEHFLCFIYIYTHTKTSLITSSALSCHLFHPHLSCSCHRKTFCLCRWTISCHPCLCLCCLPFSSSLHPLSSWTRTWKRTKNRRPRLENDRTGLRMTGLMSTFSQVFPCRSSQYWRLCSSCQSVCYIA